MKALIVMTMILLSLSAFLTISGFSPGQSLISQTFDILTGSQDITFTNLIESLGTIFAVAAGIGVIVGFIFSSVNQGILLGGITALFMTFVQDFASIIVYINGKNYDSTIGFGAFGTVITIIYGLLMVAYIIILIDWWRGLD